MKFMRYFFGLKGRTWFAGIINVFVLGLQLWEYWITPNPAGISRWMFVGFIYIQITFAQVGYKTKDKALFWGMIASALLSASILISTFFH